MGNCTFQCSRRMFMATLSSVVLGASCATSRTSKPKGAPGQRPNIVFILADDFGVGDIRALSPECQVPTPYLDRLTSQGVHFTDAHTSSAVCTPTRYGLLTGRYNWRTRLQEWVIDAYEPPLIAPDRLTLPGMLHEAGYATACIGKWHLGWEWSGEGEGREKRPDFTLPIASGPTTRGFDYYFGTDVPNFPPFTFIENDRVTIQPTAQNTPDKDMHIGFSGAPMAPGWRFDQILPTLTDRAVRYVEEQADKEQPFFLFFSMTSPHEPLSPSDAFKGKSGISPIADFLMETDWSAGQVIEAVERVGIQDNTVILFAGDNGHSHYTGWETLTSRGHKPSGPYRGHKGDIWEGGHRVPLIVRWPGKTQPGSVNEHLICLNDFMATFAAAVGVTLPDNAGEDSINMLPEMESRTEHALRASLVHHDVKGQFAIRRGPWKLVILATKDDPPVFELYDLSTDISEAHDLSMARPEIVNELRAQLLSIVERGRSTPGPRVANDTEDIDVMHLPPQRRGRPIHSL